MEPPQKPRRSLEDARSGRALARGCVAALYLFVGVSGLVAFLGTLAILLFVRDGESRNPLAILGASLMALVFLGIGRRGVLLLRRDPHAEGEVLNDGGPPGA